MKLPSQTNSSLLWRGVVFLGIFVLVSGLVGPRIISGQILFHDGFAIYGGIGKALLFGSIAFGLLVRHAKSTITIHQWRPRLLWWGLTSLLFFGIAWVSINSLLAGQRNLQNLVFAHGGLLLGLVCAATCCIGPKNIHTLWNNYKREIAGAIALAAAFYLFLLVVYALWKPLAFVVMHSVNGLLGLTGLHAIVLPPNTLLFDKFGISIAQYCSGIESIALFTSLYALVGLLDWERIHKRRYFMLFPVGLLVLCICNILRVFGLILAGYHINPHIAFSLFHTYAGMVFFIIYSAIFWSIAYAYLLQKPQAEDSIRS